MWAPVLLLPVRLLAVLVVAAVLASCGSDDGGGTAAPTVGDDVASIRVAAIAPGLESDLAATQSLAEGMARLIGVESISLTPGSIDVGDAEGFLDAFAVQGYELIIAHDERYGPAVGAVAAAYPETRFAWGPTEETLDLDNVVTYSAAAHEGGYVLGAIAAAVGPAVGIITDGSDDAGFSTAFANGAQAGGASVATATVESSADPIAMAGAAQRLVDDGALLVTGSGNAVAAAIATVDTAGARWLGTPVLHTDAAADGVVVASQVYRWEVALQPIVDDVRRGVTSGHQLLDLSNGGLVIEWGALSIPDDFADLLTDTITAVRNGDVS